MYPPIDIRPVSSAHARDAAFLISPRYRHEILSNAPFAIVGYGPLTAVAGAEDAWMPGPIPSGTPPRAVLDLPQPRLGLDVVFDGWARAECAVVVPAATADAEAMAARLDRRWYWIVDETGEMEVVDRVEGTREPMGPVSARTGARVFRGLECAPVEGYPALRLRDWPAAGVVAVRFAPVPEEGVLVSTGDLLQVPDPTPEAGPGLGAERIEALVDETKQVAMAFGWDFDILLGPSTSLCVLRDGTVLPLIETATGTAAALDRAFTQAREQAESAPWWSGGAPLAS